MKTTIPCPGCRTELNLEDTSCPVCLRGRSPQEIARGYTRVREEEEWRRRRPFVALSTLAGLAAAAIAAVTFQAPLLDFCRRTSARLGHYYDQYSDPSYIAPHYATGGTGDSEGAPPPPAPAPATDTSPPPMEPSPPSYAPTYVRPRPPRPVVPKGPSLAAAEPPLPRADVASQWVLHGRVFDLATLEPVARVMIQPKLGDVPSGGAVSDANGYFAIVLPRQQTDSGGYALETRDPRYAAAAQYESDIPYRRLSTAERRRLIQSAQENDVHSSPLSDVPDEAGVRRDVFLSPARATP